MRVRASARHSGGGGAASTAGRARARARFARSPHRRASICTLGSSVFLWTMGWEGDPSGDLARLRMEQGTEEGMEGGQSGQSGQLTFLVQQRSTSPVEHPDPEQHHTVPVYSVFSASVVPEQSQYSVGAVPAQHPKQYRGSASTAPVQSQSSTSTAPLQHKPSWVTAEELRQRGRGARPCAWDKILEQVSKNWQSDDQAPQRVSRTDLALGRTWRTAVRKCVASTRGGAA